MIRLKNNTGGYYSLKLEDITGMRPAKVFIFMEPETEVTIPSDFAATISSNEYAMAAYKKGLFTVTAGQEELDKLMLEGGYQTEEEIKQVKVNIVPDAMLLAALKNGRLEKVKEYINSPNFERLVQLATDNIESITNEKIDAIEKAAGICIRVDND